MTIVYFSAAAGLLGLALILQHLADIAATRRQEELRTQAEDRKAILETVMTSVHHQMAREMMLLAFLIDDLSEEGINTEDLYTTLHHLESARDAIAVLAQIGGTDSKAYKQDVTAEELKPAKTALEVEMATIAPMWADPVLMRSAVAAGAHYYGVTLGYPYMSVTVNHNGIVMDAWTEPNTEVGTPENHRDDTLPFVKRIVEAHDGSLLFSPIENGWRCTATLPRVDEPVLDLDARPAYANPLGQA